MSRKKTAIIKNIRDFEKQRQQTLSELFDLDDLVRGSLATVYTKCGKDNCRCKNGKGHPHARISWSEKGQGFTRKVPKDEIIWCQEKTENYRKFRSLKSKFNNLETNTKNLLNDLEDILVEGTRKDISFLWIKR
ncbi:MAG: DUF6788 family protein [Bacteroidales bacterium]